MKLGRAAGDNIFLASSRKNFHERDQIAQAPDSLGEIGRPSRSGVMHEEGDVGQLAGIADAALDRALQRERPDRAAHRDRLLHIRREY